VRLGSGLDAFVYIDARGSEQGDDATGPVRLDGPTNKKGQEHS
jgi:hypothetical protein